MGPTSTRRRRTWGPSLAGLGRSQVARCPLRRCVAGPSLYGGGLSSRTLVRANGRRWDNRAVIRLPVTAWAGDGAPVEVRMEGGRVETEALPEAEVEVAGITEDEVREEAGTGPGQGGEALRVALRARRGRGRAAPVHPEGRPRAAGARPAARAAPRGLQPKGTDASPPLTPKAKGCPSEVPIAGDPPSVVLSGPIERLDRRAGTRRDGRVTDDELAAAWAQAGASSRDRQAEPVSDVRRSPRPFPHRGTPGTARAGRGPFGPSMVGAYAPQPPPSGSPS